MAARSAQPMPEVCRVAAEVRALDTAIGCPQSQCRYIMDLLDLDSEAELKRKYDKTVVALPSEFAAAE